jgi:uncharacterized protein YqjF (DUF2071 family)
VVNEGLIVHGPSCRVPVDRASMIHRWEQVTFIHWRFDPEVVQRLLPSGLTVETFDGAAWVGLVPFYMRVALPKSRSVPWLSRFAETNVRTYVHGADGTSGVWFFSLDAARLGAVVIARKTYRLPYFWFEDEHRACRSDDVLPLRAALARTSCSKSGGPVTSSQRVLRSAHFECGTCVLKVCTTARQRIRR